MQSTTIDTEIVLLLHCLLLSYQYHVRVSNIASWQLTNHPGRMVCYWVGGKKNWFLYLGTNFAICLFSSEEEVQRMSYVGISLGQYLEEVNCSQI